jgi:rhodanese-related sulfurtransferase
LARSPPIDEFPKRLPELPADVEVVAYCRGTYCVFAHEGVRLLTAQGRRAARLAQGTLEWRLAGQAVTTVS